MKEKTHYKLPFNCATYSCKADALARGNGPNELKTAGILGTYVKSASTATSLASPTPQPTTALPTTTKLLPSTTEAPKKIQLSEGWNPTLYK